MKISPLLLLLIFMSCGPQERLTETERAAIIKEARQMLDNYCSDIRKSGLTAEFNYLDSSADFFWVPPGYSIPLSYDSVATILNRNAPLLKSIDNSFDTLRIVPLSKTMVTYTGRLNSVVTDTAGGVSRMTLMETGILIKRSEQWKLLSGQTSVKP